MLLPTVLLQNSVQMLAVEFPLAIFVGNSTHQVAESALEWAIFFFNALALTILCIEPSLYLYTVLIIISVMRLLYERRLKVSHCSKLAC